MNALTFAQLLLRRWWLIVSLAVVGAVVAYTIQARVPARYESSISLQLNPAAKSAFLPYLTSSSDATSSSSASPVAALAASYRELLRSRTFGGVVVQQLKLKAPPEAIAGAIATGLVPNTNIFRLTVTWDNPSDARQLAQRIAEIFISENLRRQQSEPTTQTRLDQLEQSARDIQARRTPLQQQRDRLDQAVAHGDFSRLPELNQLDTSLSGLETSYANVLVEMSRIRGSFDTAAILDQASPAQSVDSVPPSQAVLFGVLAGTALGIALSWFVDYLGDAVRSPRDVLGATGIPPLGRVRHARSWGWRRSALRKRGLVMVDNERSLVVEAFRSLRVSIQLNAPHHSLGLLVITSAGPGEGKTFVASNLAVALAQAGKRVLLVDADLRRPALHRVFGVSNAQGFVDALRQGERVPALLAGGQPRSTAEPVGGPAVPGVLASSIDNLWLLPAGTPPRDPSELLSSDALALLLEQLRQRWDTVVLDCAPIGPVADTLLLARQASGCLVVARFARTRRAALSGAVAALRGLRQPLVGVVLNDERPGPLARFSRDDYYQHGYWSEVPSTNGADAWQDAVALAHSVEPAAVDRDTLDVRGDHPPEPPTRRARRSLHGPSE